MSTPYTLGATWYDHDGGDPETGGHTTDGGRVFGITRAKYAECGHYKCRPLVVIDPDSSEDAFRVLSAWFGNDKGTLAEVARMTAALRSLITPPKPPCPGIGALVEEGGEQFVHFGNECFIKTVPNANLRQKPWSDFTAAVTVLSKGVQ